MQTPLVNAGVVAHPRTGSPVVGFTADARSFRMAGPARLDLYSRRARPGEARPPTRRDLFPSPFKAGLFLPALGRGSQSRSGERGQP